jgi:excisionase family DNA binding protein
MSTHAPLTVSQAAAALGVSESTIRRRCIAGKLKAEQVTTASGPAWMIDSDAVAPAATPAIIEHTPSVELEKLESDVREIKAFLAGQIATREDTSAALAEVVMRALQPLAESIERIAQDNEKLRAELRAASEIDRRTWWQRLQQRSKKQFPPAE